jgi:hypothetical protein
MKKSKISSIAFGFLGSVIFIAVLGLNFNASYVDELAISPNQAFADDVTGKASTRIDCPNNYSVKVNTTGTYNTSDTQVNNFMSSLFGYANGSVSQSYIYNAYNIRAGLGGGVMSGSLNRSSIGVTKTWTASATLYVAHTSCSQGSGSCAGTACADEEASLSNRFHGQPN